MEIYDALLALFFHVDKSQPKDMLLKWKFELPREIVYLLTYLT